jgi:hypothetical protein
MLISHVQDIDAKKATHGKLDGPKKRSTRMSAMSVPNRYFNACHVKHIHFYFSYQGHDESVMQDQSNFLMS